MQQITTLVSIGPTGRSSRPAMGLYFRSVRKLSQIGGFRRIQAFRSLDAADRLIILLDWEPTDTACAMELAVCSLLRQAERLGLEVGPLEFLEATFDRCLLADAGVATLVRVTQAEESDLPDRDAEFSLKALAAPGTTRLYGSRSADGDTAVCRIDFDAEDGLWHFLESLLCRDWADQGGLLSQTWALNLPRLELSRPEPVEEPEEEGTTWTEGSLSVQLAMSDDGRTAHIRLQGHVDPRSCELTERFCKALVDEGCQQLNVDVSDLERISPAALHMLARTARSVKATGGRFALVDNAQRVRRITRTKHLESVLI